MDPQSVAFQPRDDVWRFQDEMLRVQQNQAELSDRVSRLERQRDDDSRLKNVWGTSSPFPSVLGGTPQQIPLQQPTAEHFSNFDDHSSNLIGNLQLDADEEPRRVGATSRANSVRFDETANHGHWAHASRSSLDLIPRTGSGMGGLALSERSYSHKSDGRQSSAGHSVHSMTSGRANSLTGLGPSALMEPPGLAPGLFILGSVPAIIRCWLDTNFKHDTLLYAAVCSGSFTSYVDLHLIEQLGLQDDITVSDEGVRMIKISIYLPEAVPVTGSSRSNSPAPQLPSVVVDFTIKEEYITDVNSKAIQIFLGSDLLRAHNADLLFSSNQLTLYDDDHCKLQIPLVRPEDERTFKTLSISSRPLSSTEARNVTSSYFEQPKEGAVGDNSTAATRDAMHTMSKASGSGTTSSDDGGGSVGRRSLEQRPRLGLSISMRSTKDGQDSSPAARSGPSSAMLSNWRRDSAEKTNTGSLDWANVGKTTSSSTNYKPRDTGMKVLRPTRAGTRTLSTSTSSPSTSQSRFFDDGKRRGESDVIAASQPMGGISGDKATETAPSQAKPRSANPSSPPHEGAAASPRSSPHPSTSIRASASPPPPPRYLPPHLHDEVLADSDAGSTARDYNTGASSPSEAYANLTIGEGSPDHLDQPPRRAPRSSSPAKRPHSDMADDMDPAKPLPGAVQRSVRATSVEMADAPSGSSEASNADSSATSVEQQAPELPSLDEQVTKVMVMMQAPLRERQEGYVISEKWLERVWARTSENSGRPQDFSKEATQGPIGPVDNIGLVDVDALQDDLMDQNGEDFVPLSKATQMGQDYEVLPTKAWELVLSWYGLKEGSPVLRRYVQNTVPDKSSDNLEYELHPPVITIRKLQKAAPSTAEGSRVAEKIVASKYESFLSFLDAAKKAAGIDLRNKVRVWRILNTANTDKLPETQPSGILTPDASPPPNGAPVASAASRARLVMDLASFNSLTYGTEREIVTGKDEKANEEFNELLTLAGAGLTQDQIIVLEEHDEKGEYISDAVKPKSKIGTGNKGLQSKPSSGTSTPTGGSVTRGRARNGKVRGHTGLTNLGNTCYMNSALQCLRSVEELSMYFLSKKWAGDINASNPIGHGGAIAKVYANVLQGIYNIDGSSSFSPKNFKQTLGKANNLFSGYGQQDSQEFVSWLVDALHEDLNRVHDKPYCENPDSDDNTFRDPEAIKKLGEIYRNNHKARNDSVATDLFGGFYKNTMVCPDCDKVSITFDPYSQLTLQLPIEQTWSHTITYIPLHGQPFQLEVDIDKNATIKNLKEYVGKRGGGVPASRIMASEVYNHKYYRHLDDKSTIAESNIGSRDDIFLYELDDVPSNWPPPKKKGSKYKLLLSHGSSDDDIPDSASLLHDRIIVPVFSRGPNMSSYKSQNYAMALWPFFVVLSREEARDNDAILRKLLAKVAQMTTRPILSELADNQARSGSDVVLTTEEDASPNGDPRVTDGSVEGEDLVEVTMTDPPEQITDEDEIPEVLQPGSFIYPEFRTLFEVKHTKRSQEIVTTGWSTVDHSRTLEPISKRIRIPPSREESTQSSPDGSEGSSSDEDADITQSLDADATIDAANISSDEEMQSVEPEGQSRGGRANKKKAKKMRKQERKHKNNKNFRSKKSKIPEQPTYHNDPEDESDDSLIRMGEALVLEWEPNAYEALFGGTSATDSRGMEASKFFETREDAEIQEKKSRRAARRKHGITLDECFTETSKSEVLSEDNAWYCSRCKQLRRATKTLEIWTVPDILIIHLKRFSGYRSFRDKIEELIDFPVKGLDLSGKVGFPENKDLTYDLFAVDNHYGGLGGGHYTATAKNFFDGQWYDYNDSTVSKCNSGEKAVSRNAYLLFYRRRTPSPLGPPQLQEIVKAAENGNTPDSDDDDDENDRSRARDSGNGLRLDASSRNGSSSASTAGTGVAAGAAALRGGGSLPPSGGRGSLLKNGVAVGSLIDEDDTDLPPYVEDEGFHDAEDDGGTYGSLNSYAYDNPIWSFEGVQSSSLHQNGSSDGPASDEPNLGSEGGEHLQDRLLTDFGSDDDLHARAGTPIEGAFTNEDAVHEIRVSSE
ncbi:cysteine proteinase [Ophiobolus disseminans]|uniref:ubiquitinyl hydrolase 1 n=1 Tax=Ophiobolus disseminans TaxID=1469910 RepID=A0A6A6ZKT3_9PLEO|nr:cysteine proteinase [Ophiobolus disseminans]